MCSPFPVSKQNSDYGYQLNQLNILNYNKFAWLEAGRDGLTIFPQPGIGFYRVQTNINAPLQDTRDYFILAFHDNVDWIVQIWMDLWEIDGYSIWVRKCNINQNTPGSWIWQPFEKISLIIN